MVFIAIEGLDGCGKTTQAKELSRKLSNAGINSMQTMEPTDGKIGKFIRETLSEKVKIDMLSLQLLFVADRSEHVKSIYDRIGSESAVVVSDRYYYSTIAYGEAMGISRKYLETANYIFPVPDKTFFIEISPELAIERLNARNDRKELFEKLETLKKVKESYSKFNGAEVERIEGDRSISEISEELFKKSMALLRKQGKDRERVKQ